MSVLNVKIPYKRILKIKNIVGEPMTLNGAVAEAPGADYIINTAIFEMVASPGCPAGTIDSLVIADGRAYGTSLGLGIGWGDTEPIVSDDNLPACDEYTGCFASCVTDGKIKDGLASGSKRGRTMIGISGNNLVVYVVPDTETSANTLTTKEACNKMLGLGCDFAMFLDGGGSSQFYVKGGERYSSGRKCPAWLAIWIDKDEGDEVNVPCLCKKKTQTYNIGGNLESGRYIAKNDKCTITGITDDCLIRIEYPVSAGIRVAYLKSLENFVRPTLG